MTFTTVQFSLSLLALTLWVIGYFHTGKYVRPKWKIPGKLLFYMSVSAILIYYFHLYSLFFIIGHPLLGLIFHISVCRKHGIDWVNCEPKEKYLELQEKFAKGEFD